MKKAITTVHTIIVILGLLATAAWSATYLYNQRQFNSEKNNQRIPSLVKEVTNSLSSSETLYNKDFGDEIKRIFSENEDITALTIYSYDTGIEYFYSRNGQVSIINSANGISQNPEYKGLSFSNSIGSIPLSIKDKPGTNADFIFTVLPRTSIFYVLKISLLAVIILFVITLILIVAFSLSKSKNEDEDEDEDEDIPEWEKNDSQSDPSSLDSMHSNDGFDDYDSESQTQSEGSDDFASSSDFSLDDDLGLDSMEDDKNLNDLSIDSADSFDDLDFGDVDEFDSDDLNLEDTIPDIPDSEDLVGMDHEELPSSDSMDDLDNDFDLPEEEDLFDDMSSDDFDLNQEEIPPVSTSSTPSLYNPETGLGWESFMEERLGLELERSASFDQDLVLLMIRSQSADKEDMDKISSIIKDVYSYQDLIFEAGHDSLALIEPNKDLDEAILGIQSLFKRFETEMDISGIKCGLSSRNGRLITGKRLIKEADSSLNKADDENPIVGFRSDPEKFRDFLSHSS
ncbi:GGDEF domain-containing protein [Oceanispirochaeta crateris]|uniref:GGDEF domain-containing protein n=1 Tax=Oceanispirochaeta crateris TaxID=2518645 RepID=A0A5C1QH03_9SPIO|nr:GGDEF domain-containing protein [Oceanispirochaeta crateris]QEN07403.1 GGDEF domain-containing protein [Oceanispirochaeta crateris]